MSVKGEYVLMGIFATIAFAVTISWIVLAFTREEIPAGVTAVMSGVVTGCITLGLKAKSADHE